MFSKLLTACLMTVLIASCAKNGPDKPIVVDTGCDWSRAIYLTAHDIDVLDKQTKRDILTHNETWQKNCQPDTK